MNVSMYGIMVNARLALCQFIGALISTLRLVTVRQRTPKGVVLGKVLMLAEELRFDWCLKT